MFTNAGMNQFKNLFLGNNTINYSRIANTQKCLRVSGKHNDLEEVGHDTYHHTMFEMLGNWSFGDYFKRDAINWAWDFIVNIMKIDKDRLYVTIFQGDEKELLERDQEAYNYWASNIDPDRILKGSKKDNFWEMGDTGPCGPCSEIHVDIRSEADRKKINGKDLVNKNHPQVIEVWNLVFIQYNRKANGDLESLPSKHVDTGMGFERLCMVIQGKQSNYDTDVFQPIIADIGKLSDRKYGENNESGIAMRVIADHIRAVSFSIADGQLPSNNKAGYVIRRILRRAVRYAYTFLNQTEPFICRLVPTLVKQMGPSFPELIAQEKLIEQAIREEEIAFLRTLSSGIKLLDQMIDKIKKEKKFIISGKDAFVLYDTFGFPLDLTELILKEKNMSVDIKEFHVEMNQQKNRSRVDADVDTEDWIVLDDKKEEEFVGYDLKNTVYIKITRYRKISIKGKTSWQLVFDKTPFYGESGGQVGDSGYLESHPLTNVKEKIIITDTIKENNLIIHITEQLPKLPKNQKRLYKRYRAVVDPRIRANIANNHTATHLLQQALREVLGIHVEQKGSMVHPDYLRFDFTHFQKMTDEEIERTEQIVNTRIRQNIQKEEYIKVPLKEALKSGATALFGEKYGEFVRVIKFDKSIELCGGTHVIDTGNIGSFKIVKEEAIAAGIRRIEAITGEKVEKYLNDKINLIKDLENLLNNPQDLKKKIESLLNEKSNIEIKLDAFTKDKNNHLVQTLGQSIVKKSGTHVVIEKISVDSLASLKDISILMKKQTENLIMVLGAIIDGKPNIAITISENLVKEKNLDARSMIRDIAKEIDGGGGGQPFYATAGGKKTEGIDIALNKAKEIINGNLG